MKQTRGVEHIRSLSCDFDFFECLQSAHLVSLHAHHFPGILASILKRAHSMLDLLLFFNNALGLEALE